MTAERERLEGALASIPRRRDMMLPALRAAQAALGYLPDWSVTAIAAHLRVHESEVEDVVAGYPDLRRRPVMGAPVRVCTGPACRARGAGEVLAALRERGDLAVEEVPCHFLCSVAPVVQADESHYGRVTADWAPESAVEYGPSPGGEGRRAVPPSRPPRLGGPGAGLASLIAGAQARSARGPRLLVGAGGCGRAVGANSVLDALRTAADGTPVQVVAAGCTGMCHAAVQVTVQRPGEPDLTFGRVGPNHAPSLVSAALGRPAVEALRGFRWSEGPYRGGPGLADVPFLSGQHRLLAQHWGRVDPTDLDEYVLRGGYAALTSALEGPPEATIEAVAQAGLLGRGGAYFPTARKWRAARMTPADQRYVVMNAEEGEPGVFKDRHLLEADPHPAIEGMLIAAYAVGATRGFIYLNGEAPVALERVTAALEALQGAGLLGDRILGTDFSFHIEVRLGAGGYVLGEETALLNSIEGHRPQPRVRPPFPVERGLWGGPAVVDNVETLAAVPAIMALGPESYRKIGTEAAPGTKLICVSGDIARPGVVEVDTGTPLWQVLMELGGGVAEGRGLRAVISGGPSGQVVPPGRLRLPLEPRRADLLLGSGNLVVLDDRRSVVDAVRWITTFNARESCGKCTPCREGTARMRGILDRMAAGEATPEDRRQLEDLCETVAAASLCGLGQMAPGPVRDLLREFHVPELEGIR